MKLIRCKDQPSQTLEEFYEKMIGKDCVENDTGKAMLNLIEALRKLPNEKTVWALTSLSSLWFLAENNYQSLWLVNIIASDFEFYHIKYRMLDSQAPWPEAWVLGQAKSESEAVKMILIAMKNSGGWAFDL